MNEKILIYGNDEILNKTRGLILEKAGYAVLVSMNFEGAMLTLMSQQIDVLLLCQSLADEERWVLWKRHTRSNRKSDVPF
jgi:hypothetical protein